MTLLVVNGGQVVLDMTGQRISRTTLMSPD